MSSAIKDPALEKLELLIKETLSSANDPNKVKDNLSKAQEIVNTAQVRSQGILNKFALDGQVAVVTGAGQGIGRSICIALGEAGCKVAVADLDFPKAEAVAAELQSKGITSLPIKVDVSKKQEVESMVQQVVSKLGDLHIGVNNAGIWFRTPAEDTTEKQWSLTMDVNLTGVFYCCQAEAKHMLKMGRGSIINTASMSGSVVNHPTKNMAYNASKAGVVHMTKSMATEWATQGVRVNCISPGHVDTEMTRTEDCMPLRKHWIAQTPMGRLCEVDELLGGVLYLASPLATYTTGLDLKMDGGYTCW